MAKRPRKRQSDKAYEQLKQLIVQCELEPGTLIDERELMERLGVGRTPLREALQHLAQENLVDIVPRRGIFVAEASATDLAHVFELRTHLEGLAVQLAARRATPRHIAALEQFLTEAAAEADCDDLQWNLETDRRFHELIAEAAGNPYLQQMLDRLYNLAVRLLYLSMTRMTLIREELSTYRTIVDAIEAHDEEKAEEAIRVHLRLSLIPL